ncbi:hypothetical protein [Halalkalibacter alkaliphilus]|uniref:Uncharacterized protein n=1 Tax=Halalkalibacter alkaliphilus TaxID=2917993 RepID=A0A9X2CWP9_9BACI|nr:hypothetical protein [Halalkalibacter alkaliphilus]MCL7749129.1 hypothetical protein [Halalkalibacter alkaliphilus]
MGKHNVPLLYIYQRKEKEIEISEQDFVYKKAIRKGVKQIEPPLVGPLAKYRLDPNFEQVITEKKKITEQT